MKTAALFRIPSGKLKAGRGRTFVNVNVNVKEGGKS